MPDHKNWGATECTRSVMVVRFHNSGLRMGDSALMYSAPAMAAKVRGVKMTPTWANGGTIFVEVVTEENFYQGSGAEDK